MSNNKIIEMSNSTIASNEGAGVGSPNYNNPYSVRSRTSNAQETNTINGNDNGILNKNNHRDPQRSKFDFHPNNSQNQSTSNFNYSNNNNNTATPKKKLGTMNGVFLPTLQTLLGVILFLRLPSITAQAGCVYTTLIIIICVTSTLSTVISLSAIATNGTIQAGGPYYIISRTLGLEVGGALGLLYYLGTTMACAMSMLGGVEAILRSVGDSIENSSPSTLIYEEPSDINMDPMITGLTTVATATADLMTRSLREYNEEQLSNTIDIDGVQVVMEGVDGYIIEVDPSVENGMILPMDTQYLALILTLALATIVSVGFRVLDLASNFFLAIMFLSIFCAILGCFLFALGYHLGDLIPWDRLFMDNVWPNYDADPNTGIVPDFFSLLALFYPAVTGILSGTNRSELLEQPLVSIPAGTIGATLVSTAIHILIVWLFGLTIANNTLKTNKFILAAVAFPQDQVVKVGVIVCCIGSAMQYMTMAPQLLSAIAMDDSMPILSFIRKSQKDDGINRNALWLTCFIVAVASLSGNLDHITPLTTMCFLLMYGGINFSCFLLGFIQSPGFRPTFKYFHWSVSLFGCIWCLALALVIDAPMAVFTVALFCILLYYNHKMTEKQKDWGDVFDSVKYNLATKTLSSLSDTTTQDLNAKNWRPQLLTFVDLDSSGFPTKLYLLSLASQLKKGKGINIVVGIRIVDDNCGMEDENICNMMNKSKTVLSQYMAREQLEGFAEVSTTTRDGISGAFWSAVRHSGLGPMSPNTVLLSFPSYKDRSDEGAYWSEKNYLKTLTGIKNMKTALMILRGCDLFPRSNDLITTGIIDIWWILYDGGLPLLLPYILSKNAVWGRKGAKLRIFAITTSSTENPKRLEDAVIRHLRAVRITAAVTVVDMSATSIHVDMRSKYEKDCLTVGEVFGEVSYEETDMQPVDDFDIEMAESTSTNTDSSQRSSVTDIDNRDRRFRNAAAFNKILKVYSSESNLVVTNMPSLFSDFFDYVDTMCEGLDNVLLVKGSDIEVITTYA